MNIWRKRLDPVIRETLPLTQAEEGLGEKLTEVVFVRENLWRDFAFQIFSQRFDRV